MNYWRSEKEVPDKTDGSQLEVATHCLFGPKEPPNFFLPNGTSIPTQTMPFASCRSEDPKSEVHVLDRITLVIPVFDAIAVIAW